MAFVFSHFDRKLFIVFGAGRGDGKGLGRIADLKEALLPVQKFIKVQVSTEAAILGGCMGGPSGAPRGAFHICQLGQGAGLASAA